MNWFIDFDDTLVLGPNTWAIQTVLPDLIQQNGLTYSPDRLSRLLLEGQRDSAHGAKDTDLLDALFLSMGWPDALKANLIEKVFEQYRPVVFEDTLPFLQRMKAEGQSLYVLSNNNRAAQIAEMLALSSYFDGIFTPKRFEIERGKPHIDIWEHISKVCDVHNAVLIGDDPWSDSVFADACGIRCVIVDRLNRLGSVIGAYRRVRSLGDIAAQPFTSNAKSGR